MRAGMESFGFPSHFHDTLHEFPICHVNALLAGALDTEAKDIDAGVRLCLYYECNHLIDQQMLYQQMLYYLIY